MVSSSRPSSVASNSSQSSTERFLSPTLLSPALASTLAAGGRTASTSSSSSSSSAAEQQRHHHHHHHPGQGLSAKRFVPPQGSIAVTGRRISLPNVPSMMNRVSMVSVASFESLPEDEALGTQQQQQQLPHSPTLSDSSSSVLSPRSDLRRFPALPPSPRLRSSLSVTESSPPTSPAGTLLHHPKALPRPKSSLKRSSTEPYGMGKEFDTLMTKRRFVAMELLDTERAYMQSLKLLDENFLKPMQTASIGQPPPTKTSAPSCPQLSKKLISEIFGNFTNIFTLNKELLAQLEKRLSPQQRPSVVQAAPPVIVAAAAARPSSVASSSADDSGSAIIMSTSPESSSGSQTTALHEWSPRDDLIGDILVPIAPFLSMYKLFAQHFSNALARIDSERKQNDPFAKFVRGAERASWIGGPGSVGFGLGFEAHLLTIVQRITRYKMLVGDLVKFTPEGHADRPDLVKAFNLISQIAHDCDDNIRTHEMVLLMLNLQRSLTGLTEPLVIPGRSLLKRGALLKTCRKNIQPREFFLFTDCIMYATSSGGGESSAWQAMVGVGLASVLGADWGSGMGGGSPSMVGGMSRKLAGPALPGSGSSYARVRTHSASSSTTNTEGGGVPASSSSSSNASAGLLGSISMPTQSLQFRAKIALQDCTVVSVDKHQHHPSSSAGAGASGGGGGLSTSTSSSSSPFPTEGLRHAFELRTPEKSFALYAESREAKDDWMSRIREAREAHMIARRTLRAEEDSIEAKRERRRSLYKDHQRTAASAAAAAAAAGGAGGRGGLKLSMPGANGSSSNIATVKEGEAFPTKSGDGYLSVGGAGGGEQQPSSPGLSSSPTMMNGNGVAGGVTRERQRLNSLQSIASAIPTPSSLGGLLSPGLTPTPGSKPLKMVEDYNAPVWVPDSHADKCAVCWDNFGLWRRKHHCRLCGQVVCWNCSQRSFLIPAYQEGVEDQQARACDRCFESMFPPSEDDEEVEGGVTMGPEGGRRGNFRLAPVASENEMDSEDEEEEEDEEEKDGGSEDADADADQTARARPLPVGRGQNRPISIRVDSDASPASPATPADGPPPLLSRKERILADAARNGQHIQGGNDDTPIPAASFVVSGPRSDEALENVRFSDLSLAGPGPGLGGNTTTVVYAHAPPEALRRQLVGNTGGLASPRLFDPVASAAEDDSAASAVGGGGLGGRKAQVTAATSGAGSFRLVTPRLTTPECEGPPAAGPDGCAEVSMPSSRRVATTTRPASMDENSGDYFAGVTPRRKSGGGGGGNRFSAAARLSLVYSAGTNVMSLADKAAAAAGGGGGDAKASST
ncbi:hypothetical protein A4X13_0g562 [Tilletia indica]|uniref:1-phosphatidylinositol-3-phosphate 5-kinase n=1 Tax=Tilletia indica TaxID=43049 RepID=A0A8T8THC3_9BASI|nr:hypothetical protein A4X13_0g562 [Tilletia indica]